MVKVSVIIPVYNAEKYLGCCLDSVTAQTFRELEIICVDDGSADESPRILEAYEKKDGRIRVIRKDNGGLVAARKTGLAAATGEYIGYVDADDWIGPDMYGSLYEKAAGNGCDIVASGLYRQFADSAAAVANTIAPGVYAGDALREEVFPRMLYNGIYYRMGVRPNLVNKLFRKELLMSVQMSVPENITNGEDAAVTYPCILSAERVCLTDEIHYHYRQHGGSMSKSAGGMADLSRLKALYGHLKDAFEASGDAGILMPQLNAYISNALVQRCFSAYDGEGGLFRAFGGGIKGTDTVAVYGAGNFGRQVFAYAKEKGVKTLWADKRHALYRGQGLNVCSVEALLGNGFDHLLIAIIDETTAAAVRKDLTAAGTEEEKIRWLDTALLVSDETLRALGV